MPTKESGWITPADIEHWNRCVYEPNRERVAEYRRLTGIPAPPMPVCQGYNSKACQWCRNEICVNAYCPMRGDYCPVTDYPGMCRFDSRSGT